MTAEELRKWYADYAVDCLNHIERSMVDRVAEIRAINGFYEYVIAKDQCRQTVPSLPTLPLVEVV